MRHLQRQLRVIQRSRIDDDDDNDNDDHSVDHRTVASTDNDPSQTLGRAPAGEKGGLAVAVSGADH